MADPRPDLNKELREWRRWLRSAWHPVGFGVGLLAGIAAGRERLFDFTIDPNHIAWGPTIATGVGLIALLLGLGIAAMAAIKIRAIRRRLSTTKVS